MRLPAYRATGAIRGGASWATAIVTQTPPTLVSFIVPLGTGKTTFRLDLATKIACVSGFLGLTIVAHSAPVLTTLIVPLRAGKLCLRLQLATKIASVSGILRLGLTLVAHCSLRMSIVPPAG